jgi:hypothetical protein
MAAGDVTQKLGTSAAITCTLASLASSATAGREFTALDIGSLIGAGPLLEVQIQVKFKLQAGTIANDKCVYVFLGGSEDGTKYPDPLTGSDAACNSSNNMTLAAIIDTPTQSLTYVSKVISVAALFGGFLPRKLGGMVRNYSGIAGSATAGDHAITYTPVYSNIAAS